VLHCCYNIVTTGGNKLITPYENNQLIAIQGWKFAIPKLICDCSEILFLPPPPFLEEILPYKEIEEVLQPATIKAQFLTDKEAFLSANCLTLADIRERDLESLDKLASKVQIQAQTLEVPDCKQAPLLTLMLDIPPITTAALRLVHQIGLCYGYDLQNEEDFRYSLGSLYIIAGHPHVKCPLPLINQSSIEIHRVAKHIGIDLIFRKFLVQYPYLRNAVGTSASRWYFKDACAAAQRIFQKRWLIDNGKWT
jgi:hypothetical protein